MTTPPFPSHEELKSRGYCQSTLERYERWREANCEALALAAKLPEVFGDPPRPRITLHVARGYDDEWDLTEERVHELSSLDEEQHWWQVSAEAVACFQEYFTFSDAEGWRFYLPAFLKHYLEGLPLYHYHAVRRACSERKHFDLVTEEQIIFIEEFLTLCRTWEDS